MSNLVVSYKFDYRPKLQAFPYQAEAFKAIKDLPYAAVFHEQGLGKTKIAIDLCLYWINSRDIDTVLVVTKKQLIKNWVDEFNTHTHIKPSTIGNDKNQNFVVLNSAARVIIANFEYLETDEKRIVLFLKCRSVAIVVDESTKLKNPESNLTKTFFRLSPLFKIKVIMTGTPIANRPYDIWSQIFFLDGGSSLGKDFPSFKAKTDLTNKLGKDPEKRAEFEESVAMIFEKIKSFSVRETKASCGIELPEKTYETIHADFQPIQSSLYRKVISELYVEVKKKGQEITDDDSECLKRLLRLNQIASNPRLIDDSYSETSGKELALEALLKKILDRHEKVIVWSSYIENIDYFALKFKQYGVRKIHGSMTIEERNRSVDIFKKDPECKILFATPQSAKEGLTLTVANNVVFYDRSFNLDDYIQAQDRIHRISQTKKCTIYNILISGSIDDWIDALLYAKQQAAYLAQGDISKDKFEKVADYSYGEIIQQILKEGKDYGNN